MEGWVRRARVRVRVWERVRAIVAENHRYGLKTIRDDEAEDRLFYSFSS